LEAVKFTVKRIARRLSRMFIFFSVFMVFNFFVNVYEAKIEAKTARVNSK
jgi:hypothetical protein